MTKREQKLTEILGAHHDFIERTLRDFKNGVLSLQEATHCIFKYAEQVHIKLIAITAHSVGITTNHD